MKKAFKASLAIVALMIIGYTAIYAQTGINLETRLAHIETALWGGPNVAGTAPQLVANPGTLTTAPAPNVAGALAVGSNAKPFSSVYIGDAATNNFKITGIATGTRVFTLPDIASATFAMLGGTQTFTGTKTFTTPVIGAATGTSLSVSGSLTSTISTGTAPVIVTSTTPATHLNAYAVAYNAAGTQQVTGHVVFGKCTLGTSCSITLAGSAVYTSTTSYYCSASDQTSAAATKIVNTAADTVDITGTSTDVISYVCFGT